MEMGDGWGEDVSGRGIRGGRFTGKRKKEKVLESARFSHKEGKMFPGTFP